ncbi:MAG: SCP2 sterol-binding domain-containing protein [Rhodocyclaceae bacterium]|nr:SCP2 sterol-binding domain-containing protein [Rhodocyclaceae bacterium]
MTTFKLPDFTIPAPLTRLGNRLPQLPPTLALVTALNLALDRMIPREPLEMLIGKRFTIRVLDAGMTLRFSYSARGFRPLFDASKSDLTISARTRDFIALLAREEDPDTLFFDRRMAVEGDTDLGLLVKNTLDGIDLPRFDAARLAPAELLHRLRARLATPHGA